MSEMTYQELSKEVNGELYPDVVGAGGLPAALGNALADLSSPLRVSTVENFIPHARVESGSRFSQMHMAARERLFIFDFWSKGVVYGSGSCVSLMEAARAIHFWIQEEPDIVEMQKRFSLFSPSEKGRANEAGRAVEYQWKSLLKMWTEMERGMPDDALSPRPLIEAARERPELRQLFPFTSMFRLCFSRTTGYPFTCDCPFAEPIGGGRHRAYSAKHTYVVRSHNGYEYREAVHEVIGEGGVDEVVAMLVDNLSPNCGATVDGTARDFVEDRKRPEGISPSGPSR